MKAIVCEMCGGNNLLKQNGVFVCQSCGTMYSVEEARKLLVEGAVSIEGTVNVEGTVKVDETEKNKSKIENYLKMAKSAFDGQDYEGAVTYSDKVLEMDYDNYEGWTIRAKLVGMGSSLSNNKIPQSLTAAKRAVELAPDSKKSETAEELYSFIEFQIIALMNNAIRMPGVAGCSYIDGLMKLWGKVLLQIPCLSDDVINTTINKVEEMCNKSRGAFLPKDRLIHASYQAHNGRVSYDKMMRQSLAQIKTQEIRQNNDSNKYDPEFQNNVTDELKKYKDLMDEGAITEEEFNAKKEELLKLI